MKRKFMIAAIATLLTTSNLWAEDMPMNHEMMHHKMMSNIGITPTDMPATDNSRISIHLPPAMRSQHLATMRGHLEAVNQIIAKMAVGDFDAASKLAHRKLGLTPDMKKMCRMMGNAEYQNIGMSFHRRADELGDTLKTGDTKKSLHALHRVMNACVQCHATFRQ